MSNKTANIALVAILSVAVFVVLAVWKVLSPDSSRYQGVKAPTVQQETISNVTPVEETVEDVQSAVEEVIEATENTAAEVVEQAVTEAEQVKEEVEAAVETEVAAVEQAVAQVVETEAPAAEAQVHVVTAEGLKYNPLVMTIQPGDSVAWENMSSHDTQAIEGLIPEGAEWWHSAMGENYQRTFTVEGIYVYKCTPHFGAGMGGAIIVGKPTNLEAIKATPVKGAAKRLVKKAIQAAEAM